MWIVARLLIARLFETAQHNDPWTKTCHKQAFNIAAGEGVCVSVASKYTGTYVSAIWEPEWHC